MQICEPEPAISSTLPIGGSAWPDLAGTGAAAGLLGKAVHLVEELTQVRLIVHNCSATPLTRVQGVIRASG